jgi:hypothetical protein
VFAHEVRDPEGNLIVMKPDLTRIDLRSHTESWRGLKDQQVLLPLLLALHVQLYLVISLRRNGGVEGAESGPQAGTRELDGGGNKEREREKVE